VEPVEQLIKMSGSKELLKQAPLPCVYIWIAG
jgi:hypothetical protein